MITDWWHHKAIIRITYFPCIVFLKIFVYINKNINSNKLLILYLLLSYYCPCATHKSQTCCCCWGTNLLVLVVHSYIHVSYCTLYVTVLQSNCLEQKTCMNDWIMNFFLMKTCIFHKMSKFYYKHSDMYLCS